jgi:hypothetical protein
MIASTAAAFQSPSNHLKSPVIWPERVISGVNLRGSPRDLCGFALDLYGFALDLRGSAWVLCGF